MGSITVLPAPTEGIADAKLEAVIAEFAAAPSSARPDSDAGAPALALSEQPRPLLPVSVSIPTAGQRDEVAEIATASPPATSVPVPITRPAVDSRPASPGAIPTQAVAGVVEDAFDGKGIARASDEQQVSLAKAVCSAFDQGYSREDVVERALQEEGTTRSGVERFLSVATATTCPEHNAA